MATTATGTIEESLDCGNSSSSNSDGHPPLPPPPPPTAVVDRIKQLTFTTYDDLQTRLVLLPRDEDDEGIGAVISMYYYSSPTRNDSVIVKETDTEKNYNNNSNETLDNSNNQVVTTTVSSSNDDSTSLILDDSMNGYVLIHISSSSSSSSSDDDDTYKAMTNIVINSAICSDYKKLVESSTLLQEDFASILSTIRNHPTPIVLTFANLPMTESTEDVVILGGNNDTNTTYDTTTTTKTIPSVTDRANNIIITNDKDSNMDNVGVEGFIFEEEKKSEETMPTTSTCNNMVPTNPPPPPCDSVEMDTDVKLSSISLSPNQTFLSTTKHLSSWTSRMSAVAVTKATALAKAANEQAKVTSAMMAAVVVPEFPTSTSTTTTTTITPNSVAGPTKDDDTITSNTASNPTRSDKPEEQTPSMPAPVEAKSSVASTTTTHVELTESNLLQVQPRISLPDIHIYVQSEAGEFIPVPERSMEYHPTALVSPTKVNSSLMTNSSYIMVRVNAQQPAPINSDFRYQWYRSCYSNIGNNDSNNINWVKLPGAVGPTLQPSATEIGYRLRCVLSSNKSSSDEENDVKLICDTTDIVTAALPILNGSRQALARGVQFGSLLGQGKADGRTFRMKIVLSSCSTNYHERRKSFSDNGSSSQHSTSSRSTIAAVTIYQVVGMTAEPIHPENEPLYCRAATVWDYSQIKSIALIFNSTDIPPSASMVAALCSTDNDEEEDDENNELSNQFLYFRLQAPNRMTRESILLSLGIANFQGKPSELNASSILFHHRNNNEYIGSASSSLEDDSLVSQSSPMAWSSMATPQKITVQHRTTSFGGAGTVDGIRSDLEDELEALRIKLSRKDKVISELQRQVTHLDETQRQTEVKLCAVRNELDDNQKEVLELQKSLSVANSKLKETHAEVQTLKAEHEALYEALSSDVQIQKDRILALERENRTLQNDKDVLKAAVESRDFKLFKMEELQVSLDEARVKLTQRNNLQLELDEVNKRYNDALKDVERLQASNSTYVDEQRIAHERIASLEDTLRAETSKFTSHQSKVEMEQMKVQKLKAERNSYKQKADSLAKEMSRICRDGRTIREIEKILADDATRREEVNVLREQKRKAIEQVEHFRTAYEQSLGIQRLAGIDHDAGKLLERNAELERLLSELTEYLNAKEMQLDTMKQVNDTLQIEIRNLARANMSKNDI